MTVEVLNPEGLPKPDRYRQVAIATGDHAQLNFLSSAH